MSLDQPRVMGIINLSPDSFYSGSRVDMSDVLSKVKSMLQDGMDILDVGGQSTRPGSVELSLQEELDRVLPAIEEIHKSFPALPISIDTFRSKVAELALDSGAAMVNDISGGDLDPNMFSLIAERNVPYIAMHIRGTPQTMTKHADYGNLINDVIDHLAEKLKRLISLGVSDVILDPGFGFAKTIAQNYLLLAGMPLLRELLDAPLLTGLSRKSMFYKPLKAGPEDVLPATAVANALALEGGANILRVHDVAAARQSILVQQSYRTAKGQLNK